MKAYVTPVFELKAVDDVISTSIGMRAIADDNSRGYFAFGSVWENGDVIQ